jgi:spermidine/putrescine transport system substrate-binding protein
MEQIPELWRKQCTSAGVPYFWGTLGLAYRKDIFDTPPTSWDAILNPDSHVKGHILMMSDYTDMLLPSLFKQQLALSQATPGHLQSVYKELLELVPDVLDFDYVLSYYEQNIENRDDVYIAMAYSGDEQSLNDIDSRYEWGFSTPSEGTIVWVDCLAILASSKQQAQAIRFLEFLNQPDIAAENAYHLGNMPTNATAFSIVNNQLNTEAESTPSLDQFNQASYYNENIQISVTLRNRIAYAVIDAHHKHHSQK